MAKPPTGVIVGGFYCFGSLRSWVPRQIAQKAKQALDKALADLHQCYL